MPEFVATFFAAPDTPLVAPAQTPTINIWRLDTQAQVVTAQAMTEVGGGMFTYNFTPVTGVEYAAQANGDPTSSGQTIPGGRYKAATLGIVAPTAVEIAIAVLQEAVISNATAGSLAEYLRITKSLVMGNYVFDNQVYEATTKFLQSGRIRCFDTAGAVGSATEGGSGEGEFATFTIAGTEHATVGGVPRLVKVSG